MTEFTIIGNKNAVAVNEMFPLIKDGKVRMGYTKPDFVGLEGLTRWYTTFPVEKEQITFTSAYDPDKYARYDDYDAIEVGTLKEIPADYTGKMGVPITILENASGFEIIGILKGEFTRIDRNYVVGHRPTINGKALYNRVVIRRKKQ